MGEVSVCVCQTHSFGKECASTKAADGWGFSDYFLTGEEQNCRQPETLHYPIGFSLEKEKHPGGESRVFVL